MRRVKIRATAGHLDAIRDLDVVGLKSRVDLSTNRNTGSSNAQTGIATSQKQPARQEEPHNGGGKRVR